MKTISAFLFLFFTFYFIPANAQDSIAAKHQSTYKIGVKCIYERSGDFSMANGTHLVFSGGIPIVLQLKKSRFSIETGIYLRTKAIADDENNHAHYIISNYINFPVNFRFDLKARYLSAYISGGPFFEYLVRQHFYNWPYSPDARKENAGFNLNIGVEMPITKSMNVFVEGCYEGTLGSSFMDINHDEFRPGYINYGVAVGVNYKI